MTAEPIRTDLRTVAFPYCLQRLGDGRYVLLNRKFKPIGFVTSDWVTYETQPVAVRLPGLTPARAAKLSYAGKPDLDTIYLYKDGCVPTASVAAMRDYLKRLELLMRLKAVV